MPYFRCAYIADNNLQCDVWFKTDTNETLCPIHVNAINPKLARDDENKRQTYLEQRNGEAKKCHEMTLDELALHIAEMENVLAEQKAKLMTARAVKSDKESLLSDLEREERRKIKTPKVDENGQVTAKKAKSTTPKLSLKSDPIAYIMAQYKCDRPGAMKILGLDNEVG